MYNRVIIFLLLYVLAGLTMVGTLPVLAQVQKPVVVIDPAHGGEDTGCIGVDKVAEKDITLALAKRLKQELNSSGTCQVVLTREGDETLSVEQRKKKITEINPAAVVSIHANAGFGKTATGFELYYPGLGEKPSNHEKSKPDAKQVKNLNDTVKLAHLIRKSLDTLYPKQGRGLREADVVLLDGLTVPAVVVEIGFLTTAEEKKRLSDEKTRARIARAMAEAIETYFR